MRRGQVDVGLVVGDIDGAVVEAEVDPRHRHLAHLLVERLELGPLAPVQVDRGLLGLFLWQKSLRICKKFWIAKILTSNRTIIVKLSAFQLCL